MKKKLTETISVIIHDNGTWTVPKELLNNKRGGTNLTGHSLSKSNERWSDPGGLLDLRGWLVSCTLHRIVDIFRPLSREYYTFAISYILSKFYEFYVRVAYHLLSSPVMTIIASLAGPGPMFVEADTVML